MSSTIQRPLTNLISTMINVANDKKLEIEEVRRRTSGHCTETVQTINELNDIRSAFKDAVSLSHDPESLGDAVTEIVSQLQCYGECSEQDRQKLISDIREIAFAQHSKITTMQQQQQRELAAIQKDPFMCTYESLNKAALDLINDKYLVLINPDESFNEDRLSVIQMLEHLLPPTHPATINLQRAREKIHILMRPFAAAPHERDAGIRNVTIGTILAIRAIAESPLDKLGASGGVHPEPVEGERR